jgi:hypothetical protein
MASFVSRLDQILVEQNIPHHGVARLDPNDPNVLNPPPNWHLVTRSDGIVVRMDYDPSATSGQITAGDNYAKTISSADHVSRPLYALTVDIIALNNSQQHNIWTDLLKPGMNAPCKYLDYMGNNAGLIFSTSGGVAIPDGNPQKPIVQQQVNIIAMYLQDFIFYLYNPPFDPTILIKGDQPVS